MASLYDKLLAFSRSWREFFTINIASSSLDAFVWQERAKSLSKRKAVFEAFLLDPKGKSENNFCRSPVGTFSEIDIPEHFHLFPASSRPYVPCRDRENKIKVPRFAFLRESNLLKAIMQIENSAFLDFLRGLTHSPAFRLQTIVLRVLHYFHLYFIARRY